MDKKAQDLYQMPDLENMDWDQVTPEDIADMLFQLKASMAPEELAAEREQFKSQVRQPESFHTKS